MNRSLSLTPLIGDKQLHETKKQINKAQKIVLVTHLSPDGDAMGSSLGLYHYLKNIDKNNNKKRPCLSLKNIIL